ncbi:MAG TPA: permease-like cell division protein FtsX [Thermoanaerobaculia bacterium]|jgi:cell division transport system permease protein|nr:permease-like cell division protein FtsX [Thermoanaerobaculia bacterium]
MPHRDDALPKTTFSYFFREAARRMWVSKRTSFVAVAMIAISLFIVGAFLLVAENLGRAVAQAGGKSRCTIYLNVDATPQQIAAIDSWLAAHRDFGRREFVPKEVALSRFRQYFSNLSDVVGQLDENPFPASFECQVMPSFAQSPAFVRQANELRALSGIDEVQFDWEWVEKLKKLINLVNVAGIIAGGVLAIAAAFTIANVIRLTMLLYREEIDIMRLVGATERMIRGPFLIEGILQGFIGAAAAVALLFAAFLAGRHFLAARYALLWSFLFNGFLPWRKLLALLAGGTLAGYLGSWLSVRESGEEKALSS